MLLFSQAILALGHHLFLIQVPFLGNLHGASPFFMPLQASPHCPFIALAFPFRPVSAHHPPDPFADLADKVHQM